MTEVKENIAKKQRVNEELEAQYQELMAEVQKVQKNNKRKKIKSEAACSLVPTDREENRADQTDRS